MTIRRVALIGYPAEYFLPFAAALEDAGFEVFWVCALRADAKYLVCHGMPVSRILDVNYCFGPAVVRLPNAAKNLLGSKTKLTPESTTLF